MKNIFIFKAILIFICILLLMIGAIYLTFRLDHLRYQQQIQQSLDKQCKQKTLSESEGSYSYDPYLSWTNGEVVCSRLGSGLEIICSCD